MISTRDVCGHLASSRRAWVDRGPVFFGSESAERGGVGEEGGGGGGGREVVSAAVFVVVSKVLRGEPLSVRTFCPT